MKSVPPLFPSHHVAQSLWSICNNMGNMWKLFFFINTYTNTRKTESKHCTTFVKTFSDKKTYWSKESSWPGWSLSSSTEVTLGAPLHTYNKWFHKSKRMFSVQDQNQEQHYAPLFSTKNWHYDQSLRISLDWYLKVFGKQIKMSGTN
jgi:hypothetical protein